MILRNVERREVIVIGLDLITFVNGETHGTEYINDLVSYLGIRMEITSLKLLCRKRYIDSLCFVSGLLFFCLKLGIKSIEFFGCPIPDLVDHLAVIGLQLLRDLTHLLHERTDLAFL